jgi:non-specific serine/threonine protein kinase
VREYYRERLAETPEEAAVHASHLEHFLALAEEADPHLTCARQREWLDRLETEHDNLRAALDVASGEAGLRLAGALGHFWRARGYLAEGRERLSRALAGAVQPTTARAYALNAAGTLAYRQGDCDAARAWYEESLSVRRLLKDDLGIAASLNNLGMVAFAQGDYETTRARYEESLAIRRGSGDRWAIAASLNNLGSVAHVRQDYEAARSLYEESLAIRRELQDQAGIAGCLNNLGLVAGAQGDRRTARSLQRENLAIRREVGDRLGIAAALEALADLADEPGPGEAGDPTPAAARLGPRAVRIMAAAQSLRDALGAPRLASDEAAIRRWLGEARARLGEETFVVAWAEGRGLSLDEAIAEALG